MRALALLIGNSEYNTEANKLVNAAKDASDLGNALTKLGFEARVIQNASIEDMDQAVTAFGNDLNDYDIGLFFYAGHGFQDNGENYLSAIGTSFTAASAVRGSLALKTVLGYMDRASNSTNIIILDACREDLFRIVERTRSLVTSITLAPIYAPKGTIIAFSTSPGERAGDGTAANGNGVYTRALLAHVNTADLSIEEFFKRVRNSVSTFSGGKQTSWEHTSLTGYFSFTAGGITHARATKYSENAIADANFLSDRKTEVGRIIEDLKTHNYYSQNDAIDNMNRLKGDENTDALFVLGRNIIQAAQGGAYKAQRYLSNARNFLKFNGTNGNPLLDGMLFEVYFDSNGHIRDDLKADALDQLLPLNRDDRFKKSFEFLREQLEPYKGKLFLMPDDETSIKNVDVLLEAENVHYSSDPKDFFTRYLVRSISFEGEKVMTDEDAIGKPSHWVHYEELELDRFKAKLSAQLGVPLDRLKVSTNIEVGEDPIAFLWNAKIKRG